MIVTLTTDFGLDDGYVAAMKGAMLSVAPDVRFVDVSHHVPTQDVMEAAFVLRQAAGAFPDRTVHLVIVETGPLCRPLAARFRPMGSTGEHFYVGPDTGLLSLLSDTPPARVVVLDRPDLWRTPGASTFRGRDVFAPVAAALASGASLLDVGTPTDEMATLRWALPRADSQGVEGWVVHVDRSGTCITNIPRETVEAHRSGRPLRVYAGSTILRGVTSEMTEQSAAEPLAMYGSSGSLEIRLSKGHAAQLLSIQRGTAVRLIFDSRPVRARHVAEA
ncbi:MAG: SAM-dependent chlorinase/fluorinase [Bacteroidota bacterium]